MTTLYTQGEFLLLSPADLARYSQIRSSASDLTSAVFLGLSVSGSVDLSNKLGKVAAGVDGASGSDTITTGSGADTLYGEAGDDKLAGGDGDDLIIGDDDQNYVAGNDRLYGGDDQDILVGGLGDDAYYGGDGNDVLVLVDSFSGYDSFSGGSGWDALVITDLFKTGFTSASFNRLVLNSSASIEFLDAEGMTLQGTAGADVFDFSGTRASDRRDFEVPTITVDLGAGNDSFTGGVSFETLYLDDGHDRVNLGDGDDMLILRDGISAGSSLAGGKGNDTLIFGVQEPDSAILPVKTAVVTSAMLSAASGFETIIARSDVQLVASDAAEVFDLSWIKSLGMANDLQLMGGNDRYVGAKGAANRVDGGAANDTLIGGDWSDTLLGGLGDDRMEGGAGDDVYEVNSAGDVIVEAAGFGTDTVRTTFQSWTLNDILENVTFIGTGDFSGFGTDAANYLVGGAGNDLLMGYGGKDSLTSGGGQDTLIGGDDSDTYYIMDSDTQVIELAGGGSSDCVVTQGTFYRLGENFESLVHQGSESFTGYGNGRNNSLVGGLGSDTLYGGAGRDQFIKTDATDELHGDRGRDSYYITSAETRVIEERGGGRDIVYVGSASYVLPAYVEDLQSTFAGDFTGTGNRLRNQLTGESGHDVLYGMAGVDTLDGGYDNGTVSDTLYGGAGDDRLNGGYGDVLYGEDGDDRLNGFEATTSLAATMMYGGAGNDSYYLAGDGFQSGAGVIEEAYGGYDTIYVGSGTLVMPENVEAAVATNSKVFIYGNDADNVISGAATLVGGLGKDVLIGQNGRANVFGFTAGMVSENIDHIVNFEVNRDKILINYGLLDMSFLPASSFKVIGNGRGRDADDILIYDIRSGELMIDHDGLGKTYSPYKIAVIDNHANLTWANFVHDAGYI